MSFKIDINSIFSGESSGGAALTPDFSPPPSTAAIPANGEGEFSPMVEISGEFLHDVDVDVDKGFLDCCFDTDSIYPLENRINSVSILNLIDGTFRNTDFSDSDAPGFVRGAYAVEEIKKSNPNSRNSNLGHRIEASSDLKLDNSIPPSQIEEKLENPNSNDDILKNIDTNKLGKKSNPNSRNSNLGHRIEAFSDFTLDNSTLPAQIEEKLGKKLESPNSIDDILKNSDTNKLGKKSSPNSRNSNLGHRIEASSPGNSITPAEIKGKTCSISDSIDDILKNSDTNKSRKKSKPNSITSAQIKEKLGKKSNPNSRNSNLGHRIEASSDLKQDNSIPPAQIEEKSRRKSNPNSRNSNLGHGIEASSDSTPDNSIDDILNNSDTNKSGSYLGLHDTSVRKRKQSPNNKGRKGETKKRKNGRVSKVVGELKPSSMAKASPKEKALLRCSGLTDGNGKDQNTPDEFEISDIVWGKVQSHPWWPGQIFAPSSSSDMARAHYKGDGGFLIAYFGDHTFAWNHSSHIKPFREWFDRFEPKSAMESFRRAVDCALDEVSRRAGVGMSCLCLSKEAYDRVGYQVVVNAGIREESSRIEGGDRFSTAASFDPRKLVRFLKSSSASPRKMVDRLEVAVSRAQLLAFYQHENSHIGVRLGVVGPGRMRPCPVKFEIDPALEVKAGLRVGERLCNAISKLSGPDPIFNKRERDRVEKSGKGLSEPDPIFNKQDHPDPIFDKRDGNCVDDGSIGGRLSQLRSAARDPLGGGVTSSTARFFSEFRKKEAGNMVGSDSYWTDRVVESIPGEYSSPEEEREEQRKGEVDEELVKDEGGDTTALILIFSNPGSVPSEAELNKIFSSHGPLSGSGTKVTRKSSRAKVVFKRRPDAEAAFCSTGKFGIFGPSLVSYRLRYLRKPGSRKKT